MLSCSSSSSFFSSGATCCRPLNRDRGLRSSAVRPAHHLPGACLLWIGIIGLVVIIAMKLREIKRIQDMGIDERKRTLLSLTKQAQTFIM